MISVAMATFNGETYIQEQLDSIYNQTRKVDEIIIVDDCSNDLTVQVVEQYILSHKDIDIKLYKNEENLGYKKNFKKAISLCHGDYVFLSDQDDIWKSNKVEDMISIMEKNPNISVLASSFELIDQKGDVFTVPLDSRMSNNNLLMKKVQTNDVVPISFYELSIRNSFQGCALCLTKKLCARFLECFTEEFVHDWLIVLLASETNSMYFYNAPLFQYRIHDKNAIGLKDVTTSNTVTDALYARTAFCESALHVMHVLRKADCDFEKNVTDFDCYSDFCEKHIQYLKKGSFFRVLFQNFSSYYKVIKTPRARIMDLVFCLKQGIRR